MRSGYSLLEVLLAVALMALVGTMAAPSLINGLKQREARLALTALDAGLTSLRYQAVLAAAPLEIAPDSLTARFQDLPQGWSVTGEAPLRISAGGLCDGAELTLAAPDGRLWHRRAAAPDCAQERI